MTFQSDYRPKPRQRRAWVQVLAILLGVAPIYVMTIMSHLTRDEPLALRDIFLYTTALAGIMIVVIFLLLRYLCGERIRDLNLKPGKWWKDVVGGVVLGAITLGLHMLLKGPLNMMFPREPLSGLGTSSMDWQRMSGCLSSLSGRSCGSELPGLRSSRESSS